MNPFDAFATEAFLDMELSMAEELEEQAREDQMIDFDDED
jgi:hypothetical protein